MTKERVKEYSHHHLIQLNQPVIVQVKSRNVGPGAATAPGDKAGNLPKQFPVCIGARLMPTYKVYDIVRGLLLFLH